MCARLAPFGLPPSQRKEGFAHCCGTCTWTISFKKKRHGPTCVAPCPNGCGRLAAEFPACCRTCTSTDGSEHGEQCTRFAASTAAAQSAAQPEPIRTAARGGSSSALPSAASSAPSSGEQCVHGCGRLNKEGAAHCCSTCTWTFDRKKHKHGPACVGPCTHGCGRLAADFGKFPACCRTCSWSAGKEHGRQCTQKAVHVDAGVRTGDAARGCKGNCDPQQLQ